MHRAVPSGERAEQMGTLPTRIGEPHAKEPRTSKTGRLDAAGRRPRAEKYAAAIVYLFDRPVPQGQEQEWFWNIDEPEFPATLLEWTRIQTVLFANAGRDLERFDDEQVGMGLNYVMSNAVATCRSRQRMRACRSKRRCA